MLSIAVCDDEILECSDIARRIKAILEEMKTPYVMRQFNSGKELLHAQGDFDIVFLDIIMQDMDGMKTAELFRKKSFSKILIFLTSSREYVLDAYDVEAFRYLLKPVSDEKLKEVLQRAMNKIKDHPREFIIIQKEREKVKLFLEDIYYFEIRGRMIYVHGKKGVFSYYEKIGTLEMSLGEKGFFRCHKSYLINLQYVETYNRQEAILENGERIMIARRRYEEFCNALLAYMRDCGGIL